MNAQSNVEATFLCKHSHDEYATGVPCPVCAEEQQEAQRQADAAEWNNRRKAAETERRQRHQPIYDAIVAAIIKAGGTAVLGDDGSFIVNGVNARWNLSISEEREHSSPWRSRANGKLRVLVGSYGNRVSYPQRKDGSHNYEAIAASLIRYVTNKKEIQASTNQQAENEAAAEGLRKELGVTDHYGLLRISASAVADAPVFVKVNFSRAVTVEQAKKIHQALLAAGLMV